MARNLLHRTAIWELEVRDDHKAQSIDAGRKQEIRNALLDYLALCPSAMDTLDGIAAFWLPRQKVRKEVLLLSDVLRELAAEGVVEILGSGRGQRYRLRPKSTAT